MAMQQPIFTGTATALVTPFTADGLIDFRSTSNLIEFQLSGGIDALVLLGTTGENPTIEPAERQRLIDHVLATVNGRVPVIVGTGTNSTSTSVEFARLATSAGANGQLVVAPYYNKPTQDGFVAHVSSIADATDLPIVLYNVPGRTGVNVSAETTIKLANDIPSVTGTKEASGNLAQVSDILANRPPNFAVYSGDDELALPITMLGGNGCVSVVSNALPLAFSQLVRAALSGDLNNARKLHFELMPAMRACFIETNPIPIKAVLARMQLIEPYLRLPLEPITMLTAAAVHKAFDSIVSDPFFSRMPTDTTNHIQPHSQRLAELA